MLSFFSSKHAVRQTALKVGQHNFRRNATKAKEVVEHLPRLVAKLMGEALDGRAHFSKSPIQYVLSDFMLLRGGVSCA